VTNAVSALLMFPGPDQVADSPSLFEALVMMLAKAMPVKIIAGNVGEHNTRLWRIIHHSINQGRADTNRSEVEKVGFDETFSKTTTYYPISFSR
jgi:hypothetical protein